MNKNIVTRFSQFISLKVKKFMNVAPVEGGKLKDFLIKFEAFISTNGKSPEFSKRTIKFPKIRRFRKKLEGSLPASNGSK